MASINVSTTTTSTLKCSSEYLSLDSKNKLAWKGTLQELESFFKVFLTSCGYCKKEAHGIWSGGQGAPYKGTFCDFVCMWYANVKKTKTLLLQGRQGGSIRTKLLEIVENPIKFDIIGNGDSDGDNGGDSASGSIGTGGGGSSSSGSIGGDGIVQGKQIKSVIESKLREWAEKGDRIVIVSPFLDSDSLSFVASCLPDDANFEIYVRKKCQWNHNIEQVLIQSSFSDSWAAKHIITTNKEPSFHAKFLAGVNKDNVDLLVTSCNLTKEHLNSEQLETLERKPIKCDDFENNWMGPLQKAFQRNTIQFVSDDLCSLMKKTTIR